jgi:hypothetical protein
MKEQVRSKQITANLFRLFSLSKGRNLYIHHTTWELGLPAGRQAFCSRSAGQVVLIPDSYRGFVTPVPNVYSIRF